MLNTVHGHWSDLLTTLTALELESLWLLDPRHVTGIGAAPKMVTVLGKSRVQAEYRMAKYVDDGQLFKVAHDARLIDTNTLWSSEDHAEPRRDVENPGFDTFEED